MGLAPGGASLLGGARLKALNESFTTHSVHKIDTLADLRVQLGDHAASDRRQVLAKIAPVNGMSPSLSA